MRWHLIARVGAAFLLIAPATACSTGGSVCLPAPLGLSRTEVGPGLAITVSSPPAGCDLGPVDRYTLTIEVDGIERTSTSAEVAEDGTFEARVPVPGSATPGEGRITVVDE